MSDLRIIKSLAFLAKARTQSSYRMILLDAVLIYIKAKSSSVYIFIAGPCLHFLSSDI